MALTCLLSSGLHWTPYADQTHLWGGSRSLAVLPTQINHSTTVYDVGPLLQVKRKRKIVWEGSVTSLRRVKETVETVEQGNECGVGCKEFNGWQEGDTIEAFRLVEKKRTLEDAAVLASAAPQE